ncbi:MAG: cell surface protein SprA, partial [Rhodothermales bacterium]|nr:cell surface protein SprA [Rhodothermales bacterium]
ADGSDFVFSQLYRQKKENARTITKFNVYQISGEYKGSVASTYDLNSFSGIVPGSVRVTSAGAELTESADYIVDYTTGSLTITNDAYLIEGRDIDISFEQNSFLQIQKKTLLGLRADYDLDEKLSLGATGMRLSEKSPTDKFRIGEEPISNFIWGVDGSYETEANWLTRAIDKIPLLQTRQQSRISLSGEFAQLRPGHTQTQAFKRSRSGLRSDGRDFNPDELDGISYLDDFEGFENTLPLMQPGTWRIPSAPDSIGAVDNSDPKADSLRTNWRGAFAWYRINNNTLSEIDALAYDPNAVRTIEIDEVFPDRELTGQTDRTISTLDVYLNPHERGPYNYTRDLAGFIANPTKVWGGMVQRIPEGYNDFALKNIEFVEFIFKPFSENTANLADPDAKLYVDLGFVSEDVLPDERLNEEDGLSTSDIDESSLATWGRLPTTLRDKVVKLDDTNQRTEDVGIDGLASYGGDYPDFSTEATFYSDFISAIDGSNSDPFYAAERARSLLDPSADDYHYFGDDNYFKNPDIYPGGATVQQRFTRFFPGYELNAFESQRDLADRVDVVIAVVTRSFLTRKT